MPHAIVDAAASKSTQSLSTTCGLLPPSSSETCFIFDSAAYCSILRPVGPLPVNANFATSIWRARACPASAPNPGTTLKTPSGNPASTASSAMRNADRDEFSAGFTTMLFPIASAGPTFHEVIIIG